MTPRLTPTLVTLLAAIALPDTAAAFCSGWDLPVAFGFDAGSWGSRWPILGTILVGVLSFSAFVIRRAVHYRHLAES